MRKLSLDSHLSCSLPFLMVLIASITIVGLAQTISVGQSSSQTAILSQRAVNSARAKRQPAKPTDGSLFLPAVSYGSGGLNPNFVAVADVNGDSKPDLVVANWGSSSVAVLLGNGDGTFQAAVVYPSGGTPQSIAVADVNRDGKPDLVVGNSDTNSIGILLGNGDGTFQPALIYSSGGPTESVIVADVNGDGKPDVVVANFYQQGGTSGEGSVAVMLGNGDGTFQAAVPYGTGGYGGLSINVADVNGDGRPDLLVSNQCALFDCSSGLVSILLGNGDGSFQPATTYESGGRFAYSIAVTDVNGDGKRDLIAANLCATTDSNCSGATDGQVGVLLGNGDGTFQTAVPYDAGGLYAISVAAADINGDGKPDLVVANANSHTVSVLLGNGDGTFQSAAAFGSGGYTPQSVAIADVNGDGKPDVLAANFSSDNIGVLLNNTAYSPTSTTLTSSLNPSVFGQTVTFTAQVTSKAGTPTGTVEFFDGSTMLGTAALANGSAALSASSLTVSAHSITAAYQASGGFGGSTSAPLNQVVNAAATTTSLTSSENPGGVQRKVTYTATVSSQYGGAATGTVTFQDGGTTVATIPLANNQAAYTTSYKSVSVHNMTATYSGDVNNGESTSAPLLESIMDFTRTVLTTSGSPSKVLQPVTFTATVTSKFGTPPDGELVTFYEWNTALGSVAIVGGVAQFTYVFSMEAEYRIKADYAGDAVFAPSRGGVTQNVRKYDTATAITSAPNPSQLGQTVTFTVTVSSAGPTPTGFVSLFKGQREVAGGTLVNGVATMTVPNLKLGKHTFFATYWSDDYNHESRSPYLTQYVVR